MSYISIKFCVYLEGVGYVCIIYWKRYKQKKISAVIPYNRYMMFTSPRNNRSFHTKERAVFQQFVFYVTGISQKIEVCVISSVLDSIMTSWFLTDHNQLFFIYLFDREDYIGIRKLAVSPLLCVRWLRLELRRKWKYFTFKLKADDYVYA